MTKVVCDGTLQLRRDELDNVIEDCDPADSTLGRYMPEAANTRMVYDMAKHMFSDEELEKARNEPGGFTTAEVLEHLKRL